MLAQLFFNGLIYGCSYALVASGFGLIYFTTRTFHFAHGAVYTLSGYLLYTFFNEIRMPLVVAIVTSIIIIGVIGILIDEIIYVALIKKKASSLTQLLSSLGLYIVIINLITLFYKNETKILSIGIQPTYHFFGLIVTRMQLLIFTVAAFFSISFSIFLKSTKLGIIIRAMRDNPELLMALGYGPRKIRWFIFSIGSILAAISSILNALDVGIDPNIGMPVFLNAAIAVIIGGIGSFMGPFIGAILIGILQSLVIWHTSARWQDSITFFLFIIFLLFRPQGILGIRKRLEEE